MIVVIDANLIIMALIREWAVGLVTVEWLRIVPSAMLIQETVHANLELLEDSVIVAESITGITPMKVAHVSYIPHFSHLNISDR